MPYNARRYANTISYFHSMFFLCCNESCVIQGGFGTRRESGSGHARTVRSRRRRCNRFAFARGAPAPSSSPAGRRASAFLENAAKNLRRPGELALGRDEAGDEVGARGKIEEVSRMPVLDPRHADEIIGYDEFGLPL